MRKDLALLRLDPPLEESDVIEPIPINDIYGDLKGKDVLISGWGETRDEASPLQLQAVSLEVTSHTVRMQSAGMSLYMENFEGKGACFGDSGGNLVNSDDKWHLILYKSLENQFTFSTLLFSQIYTGPAVVKDNHRAYVVGVASHGTCPGTNNWVSTDHHLSIYVDVFYYADWIRSKTETQPGTF